MIVSFVAFIFLISTVSGRSTGHIGHGRSHSYPHSTGKSGYGSGGAQAQASHSYPYSTGLSGNANSANVRQTYHQQHNSVQNNYSPKTEVHHHYHYNPPQQISYGSAYHPVYQGHPPVYVYEYRDSGSRFDNLLTGLALYNLGRSSARSNYDSDRHYSRTPGEICKLGIKRSTGEYEETRIDCMLMSSFIWEDTSHTTRNEQRTMVRNSTEVKVIQTSNGTDVGSKNNSSVTMTVKSETVVVDALQAKGPSIAVTPGMSCYIIRSYSYTSSQKPVDCGLLQEYAKRSLYRNDSESLTPLMTVLMNILIICLVFY